MNVLLGVGGGIAAFKIAALASQLVQRGDTVRVAFSRHASQFVGARTFEGLTGSTVIESSTQVDPDGRPPHITATRDADCLVIAPATADLIARLAVGTCDDAVTLAAVLCTTRGDACRRIVCPAMNDQMWCNAVVQQNVERVRALGFEILGPVEGHLAEGYAAIGRMVEPEQILGLLS